MRLKGVKKTQRVPEGTPSKLGFRREKNRYLCSAPAAQTLVGSHAFIEARDDVALQFEFADLARSSAREFRDDDEIFRELVFGDAPRIEEGNNVPERELRRTLLLWQIPVKIVTIGSM